jgi:restriction endonuclease
VPFNLDVEMETGTGKTYCYIKTMFEMNREYGWSKFIIMVPSIAIREGVSKSFEITAEHFTEQLRQEGAVLHLQLQAPARTGELFVRRRAST